MIAEFWAPLDPYFVNPAFVWFMFAHDAARVSKLSFDRSIKLFFLLTNGISDAGIAAWDSKRFFQRPNISGRADFRQFFLTYLPLQTTVLLLHCSVTMRISRSQHGEARIWVSARWVARPGARISGLLRFQITSLATLHSVAPQLLF